MINIPLELLVAAWHQVLLALFALICMHQPTRVATDQVLEIKSQSKWIEHFALSFKNIWDQILLVGPNNTVYDRIRRILTLSLSWCSFFYIYPLGNGLPAALFWAFFSACAFAFTAFMVGKIYQNEALRNGPPRDRTCITIAMSTFLLIVLAVFASAFEDRITEVSAGLLTVPSAILAMTWVHFSSKKTDDVLLLLVLFVVVVFTIVIATGRTDNFAGAVAVATGAILAPFVFAREFLTNKANRVAQWAALGVLAGAVLTVQWLDHISGVSIVVIDSLTDIVSVFFSVFLLKKVIQYKNATALFGFGSIDLIATVFFILLTFSLFYYFDSIVGGQFPFLLHINSEVGFISALKSLLQAYAEWFTADTKNGSMIIVSIALVSSSIITISFILTFYLLFISVFLGKKFHSLQINTIADQSKSYPKLYFAFVGAFFVFIFIVILPAGLRLIFPSLWEIWPTVKLDKQNLLDNAPSNTLSQIGWWFAFNIGSLFGLRQILGTQTPQ